MFRIVNFTFLKKLFIFYVQPKYIYRYGFDILIDANLKPWILEVNGSPSMTANTTLDNELKLSVLDDTFTI